MGEHKLDRVKSHGWRQKFIHSADVPPALWTQLRESHSRYFCKGECRVILSHERPNPKDPVTRWHLSISCASRYPTWEEIKDARYSLLPLGLTFAQILPPMTDFVNVHPNCFHLWEIEWNG